MVRRIRKTMADMMVIAVSPILIMTLIGSLLFFLLAVLYQGPYETRLTVIFALFVMAIVLVARISMEEGTEYAAVFAIPLAIVTLVAMVRFVQIQGPLRSFSPVVNAALIGLVWWCAHKLTWDCTLIDDKQDSSGEGLLQVTKLDAEHDGEPDGSGQDQDSSPESTPELTSAEARDMPWLRRLMDRHRRPHAPGVWVVYFSLAALLIFGIGQTFIPVTEESTRRYVFQLFCLFVASSLGLLVTTSFLGLRRYLRQRNIQMPTDMAAVWLGVGAIVIVGLLAFTMLLPRPGAALAISQPPFSFKSLTEIRPSSFGFGNDGPESPDEATKSRADAKQTSSAPNGSGASERGESSQQNGESKSSSEQNRQQKRGNAETDPNSSQSGSKQGGSKQGGSKQGGSKQGGSKQASSPNGRTQQKAAEAQDGSSQSRNQSDGHNDESGRNDGARSDKASRSRDQASQNDTSRQTQQGQTQQGEPETTRKRTPAESEQTPEHPEPESRDSASNEPTADEQHQSQNSERSEPKSSDDQTEDRSTSPKDDAAQRSQDKVEESELQKETEPQKESESQSGSNDQSPKSTGLKQILDKAAGGLAFLLKAVFFLLLVGAAIFLLWKYRDRLLEGLRQLIADFRHLLARLFGRSSETESQSDADEERLTPSHQPFSAFADPFLTDTASGHSTEQLVRYSFEALEAWATERSCGRDIEQTPTEFAQQVGDCHPRMGRDAQVLAELYSRIAYGHERVSAGRQEDLQSLWQQMRTAPPPAPR